MKRISINHAVIALSLIAFVPGMARAENMFATLLGKSEEETASKIESVWNHFFTPGDLSKYGEPDQKSLYYLDGDEKAFVMDTGSDDVRTEGMSYGMMISVQLNHREEFDKLWKWSKQHMAYPDTSPWNGYFCWQCSPDGRKIGGSNASDGEIYYVTALFLAGQRWNDPSYTAAANEILAKTMSKNDTASGVYDLFDRETNLVVFVPDSAGRGFTDPSYMLPAFLDQWARVAGNDREFWGRAARSARNHLVESAHPLTGLHPDYSKYDGSPFRWPQAGYDTSDYMYDAIRCAMNMGMDTYLTGKDADRQRDVLRKLLRFFKEDGFMHGHFSIDGSKPSGEYSRGMDGSNAVGAIALAHSSVPGDRELASEFVQRLWDAEPPAGKFRYYEGMVYFLSLLHVSGNFSLDFK